MSTQSGRTNRQASAYVYVRPYQDTSMLHREAWRYLPLGYVLSPEDIAAAEAAALSDASPGPSGSEPGATAQADLQQ